MYDVANMGHHLILEFNNISSDIKTDKHVDTLCSKLITDSGVKIETRNFKEHSQGVTYIYILADGHFCIHTFPESKSCAIDFYYSGNDSMKKLEEAETIFCNNFGWENCTNSMLFQRGGKCQALLNHYDHASTYFKNVKMLYREKTKYQDMRIYDTKDMGRVLSLDAMIQITDGLEDNYTVDLTRTVLDKSKKYDHVLIIGAGDMIIPTYLIENYKIKKVTVCEIDDRVPEITKKYFKFCDKVDDYVKEGKLEVVIEDGAKYLRDRVEEKTTLYDGLIIDNSDVYIFDGPAASLFTPELYTNILAVLKPGAAFSQQVSDEHVKAKWEAMCKSVGFNDISYNYSNTPEYSTALPLGIARKDNPSAKKTRNGRKK